MKVQDVINHLQEIGYWVNWDKTRDIVLHGDTNQEITKIGVCWVATKQAILKAKEEGINFIISHENIFYEATTNPARQMLESANEKRALLNEAGICVYRCHDVWDNMPIYGVADTWAKDLGLSFEPRIVDSFYSFANVSDMTVQDVADRVASAARQYGEEAITVIGDLNKSIHRVAVGTGAETNVFEMLKGNPDIIVASDDGVRNWVEIQWCIDNAMPIILVNHASCEIGGLKNMVNYFKEVMPELDVQHLDEHYHLQVVVAKN